MSEASRGGGYPLPSIYIIDVSKFERPPTCAPPLAPPLRPPKQGRRVRSVLKKNYELLP